MSTANVTPLRAPINPEVVAVRRADLERLRAALNTLDEIAESAYCRGAVVPTDLIKQFAALDGIMSDLGVTATVADPAPLAIHDPEPFEPSPEDAEWGAANPILIPERTLAETVEHEAIIYRAWGTPMGDFLGRQMDRLAQLVRWTGATTPEDHEARMEVWDDEIRAQQYDRGYADGIAAGRGE